MANFVICLDLNGSEKNKVFDIDWINLHPGSGWFIFFKKKLNANNDNFVTGDIALIMLQKGKWLANETYIIDELGSKIARKLVRFGCVPFLQSACEAPLYAPLFYDFDNHNRYKINTRYIARECVKYNLLNQFFPSFYRKDLNKRPQNHLCMVICVAANKYRTHDWNLTMVTNLNTFIKWTKHNLGILISKSYRQALSRSNHNHRLKILSELSYENFLDLYGAGWDNQKIIPNKYNKIFNIINKSWRGRVESKYDIIKNYQFGLCIENMEMNGYITEKIFDCLAAGVIPIYLGAPDICNFVPKECFIDLRKLITNDTPLANYLKNMSESDKKNMQNHGKLFLQSENGDKYSHEGFAEFIYDLYLSSNF